MTEELEEVPPSEENKIPKILIYIFILLFIGGLAGFFINWNGAHGWFDRGYWQKLQQVAETTYPYEQKESYFLMP